MNNVLRVFMIVALKTFFFYVTQVSAETSLNEYCSGEDFCFV